MKTRTYTSALREQQAEQTRLRIIEALVAQVVDQGLADFAVPQVAREAGVSTRTVYRYFPTRDDLLAAVGDHLQQVAPGPEWPAGPADLARYVRELFFWFEANQQLVQAAHITQLGRDVQARLRSDRWRRVRALISSLAGPGDPDGRLAFGPIRALMSSQSWLSMTRELGMSTAEAADAVCDVIEGILAERAMEADHPAAAAALTPGPLRGLFAYAEIDL
ncbi:MAG: TetR/AcrR family transcriptional regulator [Myxococcales bacterium]|nr:TetR/AcrR family transcriptional regulator [Myxococcales bacterium]